MKLLDVGVICQILFSSFFSFVHFVIFLPNKLIFRWASCLLCVCPPPFRRKAEGHCFWLSVVRGSRFLVGTLSSQLLQFEADPFETLQVLLGWSEDMHVLFSES